MGKNLILPSHLRKELKKPLGKVVSHIKKSFFENKLVICVGDRASEKLLNLGVFPKICLYDGKVNRKEVGISPVIRNFPAKKFQVKNPPGTLTGEVFQKISQALKGKEKAKIYVEGEEDLCALAAIHLSPLNSIVVYGQPGEGLVIVEVNKNIKNKVNKVLKEMKEDGD